MNFVLKCTIDPEFLHQEFAWPITNQLFVGLEAEIVAAFEGAQADFARHIADEAEEYSFEALISDAFDLLSRFAAGCLFIEKNQADCKVLTDYYVRYRKAFFSTMLEYIKIFTKKGIIRPLKHMELSVRMIIEILSWWAMDIRYISFESWDISPGLAKAVCLDNILAAYQV